MTTKRFTLDEANRTIPLVKRIVQDIVDEYTEWKNALRRYEIVASEDRPDHGESGETEDVRSEVDAIAARINEFIEELKQIGCVLKGFDDGLVDFYSAQNGRDVCLCWRLGEDRIEFWHEVDAGFTGRQPVRVLVTGGEAEL
ncbi:MAG TPA: DUF2203 domain-containing protein [Gemmatimonadales bacterium]